ncbi:uncharacterized protein LOC113332324 [Papaver somniferum]|uniref:uncharacterized protein LOC113332324 n=1 Tax=Papaver somniferum TaxID=3469 RepID=UPI000E6FA3D8|nr:uncharacterized protein LOC113332324 [Papaver somniferum]
MQLDSSGKIPRDPEPPEVFIRRYTYRGQDEWHKKLTHDHFLPDCMFSDENFQGRFRMPRHLVLKIIGELCKVEPQFNYQYDALNIRGHSPEQKVTSALSILGYGRPPNSNDEYLRIDLKYGISPQPHRGEMGRSYSYFNSIQMDLTKDVEWSLGILKRKFAIICGPYRGLSAREMHNTMLTCIITHNMVEEDLRANVWAEFGRDGGRIE